MAAMTELPSRSQQQEERSELSQEENPQQAA
jgi:hypothetical protein